MVLESARRSGIILDLYVGVIGCGFDGNDSIGEFGGFVVGGLCGFGGGIDTALFVQLPERGAADLFSGVQALTMLFSIPAAGIAGLIFAAQPVVLFVLIAVLNLGLVGMAWVIFSFQKQKTRAVS